MLDLSADSFLCRQKQQQQQKAAKGLDHSLRA